MPYLIHREAGTLPTLNTSKQMTASEIAFVIKQNQQMIDTFTKRNAPGDAEKVQELQAANEQIKLAGLFC